MALNICIGPAYSSVTVTVTVTVTVDGGAFVGGGVNSGLSLGSSVAFGQNNQRMEDIKDCGGAVAWDNVTPVVDSGKSTSGLQKLVWQPQSATNLAAVDTAYGAGAPSADGTPGLAQVYSHTNQQMYYKSASQCPAAKAAVADADARYTLAAWCFSGSDETSDA